MQDTDIKPTSAYIDPGYRGVERDNPELGVQHRGEKSRLTEQEIKLTGRCQAVEPIIGHLKEDHRMGRCHLKGEEGDRMHAVLCMVGYNICWLLRMIAKNGLMASLRLIEMTGIQTIGRWFSRVSNAITRVTRRSVPGIC